MKNIYILLITLCCFTAVNAQKNYPILTFEEIGAATIVNHEVIMIVVENIGEVPNLAFYDLEKKELMQKFSAKLPENPVSHIIPCDNGLVYLLTIRRADESGYPMFDAIYSFDYKKDKLQKIYTENDPIPMPSGASAVHTKLVLSGRAFHEHPRIFNLNTKEFEVLSDDESLRVLCTSDKHSSYVVIKFSELTEDDTFPVYVLDKDGKMSEQLGVYDSRMRASSNKEENHMPGFTITNADYNWIPEAFDNSGFPLSGFAIAMHPGLAEKYNKTDHIFDISEIVAANETYMAASGKGQFWVYNTKTPNTNKPKTVSEEDMAAIIAYFNKKTEYIKIPVQSAALEQVFNAKFYSVTEKIKEGDYGFSESSFIAFSRNNEYEVLMNKTMLTTLIAPEFKIENEQNASVFQDALNALYPPGTFDIKHIKCYKKDNNWCFVRGESFGDKKGFVVQVNNENKVEKVEFSNKIN